MRLLMANEPRSHREVSAGALRALHPHGEAITVGTEALEGEATRAGPQGPTPGLDVLLQFVDRGEEQPEPPGKRMTPRNGPEV